MKIGTLFFLAFVTISASAQIPTAGLVGHYDFNNGALTDNINGTNFNKTGTASTNIVDTPFYRTGFVQS